MSTTPKRAGIYLNPNTAVRLTEVTARLQVTQSELLAALVTVASDDEIRGLVERYRKTRELEKTVEEALTGKMLQLIKGKTQEELQQILAAAQASEPTSKG